MPTVDPDGGTERHALRISHDAVRISDPNSVFPMSLIRTLMRAPIRIAVSGIHATLADESSTLVLSRGKSDKEAEVLLRIEGVLERPLDRAKLSTTPLPSLWRLMRAGTVIEVDEGTIPAWYRKVMLHIFDLDYEHNAYDGWEIARLASVRIPGEEPARVRRTAKLRLQRRVQELRLAPKECVYAFGTGPSLARAREREFSDGVVIVCNTIVRDPDLWKHLSPEFIVAGDAIYHFGFTEHARAFRRDLLKRLSVPGTRTLFVYPELFDRIVRRELRSVEHLLIPVPIGRHTDISVDLVRRFELPALGNVLNGLLLPLGCTIAKHVRLWGFDGRAPDDKLFWSNSRQHAYPELMPGLVAAHPAFYETLVPKGKETNYVKSVHGDDLHRRMLEAESRGYVFEMMHHSWTETLNRRRRDPD